MVLDATREGRQAGRLALVAGLLLGAGCAAPLGEQRNAQVQNQRMDTLDRCQEELARREPSAARSQNPAALPADIKLPPDVAPPANAPPLQPVTNVSVDKPADALLQGEPQVRIVATIGTTPIYEREVREAVYQRLPELIGLPSHERKAKEKAMFREELKHIIERELVLDELFAMLKEKKQSAALKQLKEAAEKEAETRIHDIQKRAKLPSDEDLKQFFNSQGLTLSGIRRHFERSFMMSAYLGERLKPKVNSICFADIKDYYEEHPDEFQTGDRVKWQDLFIRVDRFKSPADAKLYADWLLKRMANGEDIAKLIEFDQGDAKSRAGVGFGEERGKIFPPELEGAVFALKPGQATLADFGTGYHVIRVAEREFAGRRPFADEQVQAEIRRRLQGAINQREYHKIVDSLWRRARPQILAE
jgi:hypothetical protein